MRVGDVVVLCSGGPAMTGHSIGGDRFPDTLMCKWFDEQGDLKQHRFKMGAVRIAKNLNEVDMDVSL